MTYIFSERDYVRGAVWLAQMAWLLECDEVDL